MPNEIHKLVRLYKAISLLKLQVFQNFVYQFRAKFFPATMHRELARVLIAPHSDMSATALMIFKCTPLLL